MTHTYTQKEQKELKHSWREGGTFFSPRSVSIKLCLRLSDLWQYKLLHFQDKNSSAQKKIKYRWRD